MSWCLLSIQSYKIEGRTWIDAWYRMGILNYGIEEVKGANRTESRQEGIGLKILGIGKETLI